MSDEALAANWKMNSFGDSFNADNGKAITITYAQENTHHESIQVTRTEGENSYPASDYLTGLLFRAQYKPGKVFTSGNIAADDASKSYTTGDDFWLFRYVGNEHEGSEVAEKYNLYFASEESLNEYIATLPAGGEYETAKYTKGICYYNIWIKHANIDGSDENFPMKYGIVRNNIYRISLEFNGIGQPTPEITEPYNITSRIFVVKWNFRPQDEIVM